MSTTKKQQSRTQATNRKKVTKKSVKKTSVARTLSNDEKNARMEVWAAKMGLDKDVVTQMTEKYGPYAYDVMSKSLYPGRFHETTGYPYYNTKQLIKHLTTEEGQLTDEQLAKLTKKDLETIRSERNNYRFEARVDKNTSKDAEIQNVQAQATQQVARMNTRIEGNTSPEVSAQRSELTEKQRKEIISLRAENQRFQKQFIVHNSPSKQSCCCTRGKFQTTAISKQRKVQNNATFFMIQCISHLLL